MTYGSESECATSLHHSASNDNGIVLYALQILLSCMRRSSFIINVISIVGPIMTMQLNASVFPVELFEFVIELNRAK